MLSVFNFIENLNRKQDRNENKKDPKSIQTGYVGASGFLDFIEVLSDDIMKRGIMIPNFTQN